MDSRRDFTSKKVFSGYFSELGEKANSALLFENLRPQIKRIEGLRCALGRTERRGTAGASNDETLSGLTRP